MIIFLGFITTTFTCLAIFLYITRIHGTLKPSVVRHILMRVVSLIIVNIWCIPIILFALLMSEIHQQYQILAGCLVGVSLSLLLLSHMLLFRAMEEGSDEVRSVARRMRWHLIAQMSILTLELLITCGYFFL